MSEFDRLMEKLDYKFAEFRQELREGQDKVAAAAARKVRQEPKFVFKKKSHEEQDKVNGKVEEAILEAETHLEESGASGASIDAALDSLKSGRRIIAERQKLIKIADRSELGWAVVSEYTADELADDSDDEKRMLKAEKAAERKVAARKRKSPAGRGRPVKRIPGIPAQYPAQIATTPGQPFQLPRRVPMQPAAQRQPGPCFNCGQMGHLKSYCPIRTPPASSKSWYPPIVKVHDVNVECCMMSMGSEMPVVSYLDDTPREGGGEYVCTSEVQVLCEGRGKHVQSIGGGHVQVIQGECVHEHVEKVLGSKQVPNNGTTADVDKFDVLRNSDDDIAFPVHVACAAEVTFEAGSGSSNSGGTPPVKGRLQSHISFWKEKLGAPQSVLSIIQAGYVLPLKSDPPMWARENQSSARIKHDFVQASINELLGDGCIRRVESKPHICSPLSVVESNSGKLRLVVNLRYLNRYLWKQKFKYEDLRTAMLLFEKDDYMFSFDLKSGYHHVDIASAHQKFLGIEWGGAYFVFTVLPFGLSTACYVFTKLLRPLVRYWRASGIRIVVYLDDGLAVASGEQEAATASSLVRETLCNAGFITHPIKSQWAPVQRLTWLGFIIDMSLGHLEVPKEKITSLQCQIRQLLSMSVVPARLLACVVGKIIAMGLAIGPLTRYMTRSLYALMESRCSWCERLALSAEAKHELAFWEARISEYNAQPFWRVPSAVRVVYSDASDTGFGGYMVEHGPCTAYGQWSPEEATQSSTWRELTAVYRVLHSMTVKLRNSRVRWFTDNQNVVRILQVGWQ